MADLQQLLGNSTNPLKGPNAHPFRFVFISGCLAGKGNVCTAFGIPQKENLPLTEFSHRSLRPRAFLGWKHTKLVGYADSFFNPQFAEFNYVIFQGLPPSGNYPQVQGWNAEISLSQAVENSVNYSNFYNYNLFSSGIVLYGYPGLLIDQ